ncbi:hypothetical protein ACJX0J_019091 [Zea mays]
MSIEYLSNLCHFNNYLYIWIFMHYTYTRILLCHIISSLDYVIGAKDTNGHIIFLVCNDIISIIFCKIELMEIQREICLGLYNHKFWKDTIIEWNILLKWKRDPKIIRKKQLREDIENIQNTIFYIYEVIADIVMISMLVLCCMYFTIYLKFVKRCILCYNCLCQKI